MTEGALVKKHAIGTYKGCKHFVIYANSIQIFFFKKRGDKQMQQTDVIFDLHFM